MHSDHTSAEELMLSIIRDRLNTMEYRLAQLEEAHKDVLRTQKLRQQFETATAAHPDADVTIQRGQVCVTYGQNTIKEA